MRFSKALHMFARRIDPIVSGGKKRSDSLVKDAPSFTPSFSFFVECESEEHVRDLVGRLKEGGPELLPAGNMDSASFLRG